MKATCGRDTTKSNLRETTRTVSIIMGSVCSNQSRDPQNDVNRKIGRWVDEQQSVEKRKKKLLLLGAGSAGKSTLFKKLRSIKSGGLTQEEREGTRPTIRQNVVASILMLAKQTQMLEDRINNIGKKSADSMDNHNNNNNSLNNNLSDSENEKENEIEEKERLEMIKLKQARLREEFSDCQLEITPELNRLLEIIVDYHEEDFTADMDLDFAPLQELAQAVKHFWSLAAIQNIYRKRGSIFSIPDNMNYFLDKVELVMSQNYVPTEEDLLRARARTIGKCFFLFLFLLLCQFFGLFFFFCLFILCLFCHHFYVLCCMVLGMTNYVYDHGNHNFNVYDVGGQRSERSKWIHQFEQLSCYICFFLFFLFLLLRFAC